MNRPPRPGRPPGRFLEPGEPLPPVHRIVLALGFVMALLLCLRQVGSPDIGFHLRAGNHILGGHGWPRTDPFTETMKGHPYIDTSWGFQVLAALFHRMAGPAGLVAMVAILVLGWLWLLYKLGRLRTVEPTALVILIGATALVGELRFEPRPELFSYLLLTAQLYLLHARAAGRRVPLWAPIAVQLVWTNVHSLFVLGWVMALAFAVGRWLETRRFDLDDWKVLAGVVAVGLLNPYGIPGLLFPFRLLTRFRADNPFADTIGEFTSPFDLKLNDQYPFYPWWPVWTFRLLALVALPAALVWLRKGRWSLLLPALLLLPLSLKMIRNMPLLALALVPGLAATWPLLSGRPRRRARSEEPAAAGAGLPTRVVLALAGLVMVTLSLRVYHDAYYIASRRGDRFGLGWNRDLLPVEAARWADRMQLPGAMLNHLNFGGYLMWAQSKPVFIDGRLEVVGEAFYGDYRRIIGSEVGLENAVARYGLGWIIFPYAGNSALVRRLSGDPRWRLAWFDRLAVVFVREGPGIERYVDPRIAEEARPGLPAVAWNQLPGLGGPPRPPAWQRWFRGLVAREVFPFEDHYKGLMHFFRLELEPARRHFTDAIARSHGWYYETYLNLGSILYRSGEKKGAQAAYQIVLAEQPENRTARERTSGPLEGP